MTTWTAGRRTIAATRPPLLRCVLVFLVSSLAGLGEPRAVLWYEGSDLAKIVFPPGDDEMHYAFGAAIASERFQIDVGADLSDLVDTLALSAIYRF